MWRGGLGGAYRLPTLSSVGASLAPPCSPPALRLKRGVNRHYIELREFMFFVENENELDGLIPH